MPENLSPLGQSRSPAFLSSTHNDIQNSCIWDVSLGWVRFARILEERKVPGFERRERNVQADFERCAAIGEADEALSETSFSDLSGTDTDQSQDS